MAKKKVRKASTIANRFLELRKHILRLTQLEMSEILNTTQSNISQIEKGGNVPGGNFIQRLADHFPIVNLNWLFYNEGFPTKDEEIKRTSAIFAQNAIKETEKKTEKIIQKLNAQIDELRANNTKLIDLATKGR